MYPPLAGQRHSPSTSTSPPSVPRVLHQFSIDGGPASGAFRCLRGLAMAPRGALSYSAHCSPRKSAPTGDADMARALPIPPFSPLIASAPLCVSTAVTARLFLLSHGLHIPWQKCSSSTLSDNISRICHSLDAVTPPDSLLPCSRFKSTFKGPALACGARAAIGSYAVRAYCSVFRAESFADTFPHVRVAHQGLALPICKGDTGTSQRRRHDTPSMTQ